MNDDMPAGYGTEKSERIAGLSFRDDAIDSRRHSLFRKTLAFMRETPGRRSPARPAPIWPPGIMDGQGTMPRRMAEHARSTVTGERIEIK